MFGRILSKRVSRGKLAAEECDAIMRSHHAGDESERSRTVRSGCRGDCRRSRCEGEAVQRSRSDRLGCLHSGDQHFVAVGCSSCKHLCKAGTSCRSPFFQSCSGHAFGRGNQVTFDEAGRHSSSCLICASHGGHSPVVARDMPGFIVNHAGRAFGPEALRILSEQTTDAATIDAIMKEAQASAWDRSSCSI